MTTAKKAFFLYRDWCIAKYLREDANWADYPEIFVSAWEYAWNDGFDTVSHESIYTNLYSSNLDRQRRSSSKTRKRAYGKITGRARPD